MTSHSLIELAVTAVAVLAIVLAHAADHLSSFLERLQPDPVEQAKQDYAAGRITESEFRRRLEYHLDDRNDRIEAAVDNVGGIGEARRTDIARHFDSLHALERASREELQEVNGIGPQRAAALEAYLSDGTHDPAASSGLAAALQADR